MGCDIHLFCEKKIDGKWEALKDSNEAEIKNCKDRALSDPSNAALWEEYAENYKNDYNFIYSQRNYNVFAMLANVRNYGYAHVAIDTPRGLPHDASDLIKTESQKWGVDGHSHSYLTVKELLDYNWDRTAYYNNAKMVYKNEAGIFYDWSLPKLKELAGDNLESVRIVFWFDN